MGSRLPVGDPSLGFHLALRSPEFPFTPLKAPPRFHGVTPPAPPTQVSHFGPPAALHPHFTPPAGPGPFTGSRPLRRDQKGSPPSFTGSRPSCGPPRLKGVSRPLHPPKFHSPTTPSLPGPRFHGVTPTFTPPAGPPDFTFTAPTHPPPKFRAPGALHRRFHISRPPAAP